MASSAPRFTRSSLLYQNPACKASLQILISRAYLLRLPVWLSTRIPPFSNIYMTEQLHWIPLFARIQLKIHFLNYRDLVLLGLAPCHLCKFYIICHLIAISDSPYVL